MRVTIKLIMTWFVNAGSREEAPRMGAWRFWWDSTRRFYKNWGSYVALIFSTNLPFCYWVLWISFVADHKLCARSCGQRSLVWLAPHPALSYSLSATLLWFCHLEVSSLQHHYSTRPKFQPSLSAISWKTRGWRSAWGASTCWLVTLEFA